MLLGGVLALLIIALAWRGFVYQAPRMPVPAVPVVTTPTATDTSGQNAADASSPQLILDLFHPSESALQTQHSESQFKRQLEETITLMFVLRRCNYLDDSTYRDTYHALYRFAQNYRFSNGTRLSADAFGGIVASARDSYRLLYATLSCDTPNLAAIATQLDQWRGSIENP